MTSSNSPGAARGVKAMAYKKGGPARNLDSFDKGQDFVAQIAEVAEVPGGLEMLTTMAADELGVGEGGGSKQLRLYTGGSANEYAEGGLSQAAEETRSSGRNGDEMLLHVSPEELEALTSMWGTPTTNPKTGLPEYFIHKKIWKGIKKTIKKIVKSPLFGFLAPIALNIFAPGLGSAIGGWLGATGQAASTIGNTLVRTGIGALSGGKDGAISGALSGLTAGGVGGKLGEAAGLSGNVARIAGDAVLGGAAGEATGVGFQQGALGQGMASVMNNPMQKISDRVEGMGRDIFKPGAGEFDVTPGSMTIDPSQDDPFGYGSELLPQTSVGQVDPFTGQPTGAPSGAVLDSGVASDPSMWDRTKGWMKDNPWLVGAGALGAGYLLSNSGEESGQPGRLDTGTNFYDDLPNLSFNREQMPIQDYYNYGRASAENPGEASFFNPNSIDANAQPPGPGGGGPGGGRGGGRGGRGGQRRYGPTGDVSGMTGVGPMPGGGDQPRKPSGAYGGMIDRMMAQQQGWQFNEQDGMLYPPGWYGPGGSAPIAGAYEGGYVDAAYALGGLVRKYQAGGHVRGEGTGRSDSIPAVLSDGEYVIDSESVALLGDGSTDAGARRLDEMRKKLRKHKAKKLAKGGFSDAAKKPEAYMAKGGEVTPTGNTTALKDLKRLAKRLEQAITSGNKKRVREITSQLRSMDNGDKMLGELARGGSVRTIIDSIERNIENPDTSGVTGPRERRAKTRRKKARAKSGGKKKGRRLTDKEKADLAEELGRFSPNSAFIRRFKQDLADATKEES